MLGASGGIYMLIFSGWYLMEVMTNYGVNHRMLQGMFFLRMSFAAFCFSMMCAFVSYMASYMFVERIYRASSSGEFSRI
jgi:hypothetical protein